MSAISSSSGSSSPPELETRQTVKKSNKKSLHIPIHVCGRRIFALVDTGPISCFIQFSLVKKWGIWDKKVKSTHQVRYANGVVEPVLGIVPLETTL